MGSLVAGCRVYAGYPITPATDIMEFLAAELPKVGGAVVQAEDEMAALGMVLGASYAGKKAMTATSGPGFSLMVELMGLAGMAEIPVVIVDAQRAGPSTGMPTRHEQGDLYLAALGGHGEIQRIVLAPASVTDCFSQAINAFNLAEQFQMPVMLLGDTTLGVRTESIPTPDLAQHRDRRTASASHGANGTNGQRRQRRRPGIESGYKRYQLTETGVSPMAIPGQEGGQYVATGLEHNERPAALGRRRTTPDDREAVRKMELAREGRAAGPLLRRSGRGGRHPHLGLVLGHGGRGDRRCWPQKGIKVAAMAPRMLWPLPDDQIAAVPRVKRVVLVPEVNYSGQFAQLMRARYLRELVSVNVYSGGVFTVARLVQAIEGVHQHAR